MRTLLDNGPILRALLPQPTEADTGSSLLFLILAMCAATLLAMILLVLAEVLVPDGSLPGPVASPSSSWASSSRPGVTCCRRSSSTSCRPCRTGPRPSPGTRSRPC